MKNPVLEMLYAQKVINEIQAVSRSGELHEYIKEVEAINDQLEYVHFRFKYAPSGYTVTMFIEDKNSPCDYYIHSVLITDWSRM